MRHWRMFFVVLYLLATRLQAGLIIDVLDASLVAGGTGYVDVAIRSDGGPDTLGRFDYQFSITGATPTSGDLQFQATQSKSEQNISSYIFYGDTDPANLTSVRGGNAVTLVGGDVLAAGNDVPVPTSDALLARLELEHVGAFTIGSHSFTISLDVASSEFDRDFDPGTANSYATFTALPGSVTVSVTSNPEPSTLALSGLAGTLVGLWRWRRRRGTTR